MRGEFSGLTIVNAGWLRHTKSGLADDLGQAWIDGNHERVLDFVRQHDATVRSRIGTEDTETAVVRLAKSGVPVSVIASSVDRTVKQVRYVLSKRGVVVRPPVDSDLIVELARQGLSRAEIVEITGHSYQTIHNRCGRAKRMPKKNPPELATAIQKMRDDGYTYAEIQKTLHVSPNTIRSACGA